MANERKEETLCEVKCCCALTLQISYLSDIHHVETLPVRWHLALRFAEEKKKRKIQTKYVKENARYGGR